MRTALIVAITLAFAVGANATVATEAAAELFKVHRIVVVESAPVPRMPLKQSRKMHFATY